MPEGEWEYYDDPAAAESSDTTSSSVQDYLTTGVKKALVTVGFITGCYLYQRWLIK